MKPEVSHPTPCCPDPSRWHCYNSDATEVEVLDLLTVLVDALKPYRVIETGCHEGYGTDAIIRGLPDTSKFFTCDIGTDRVEAVRERFPDIAVVHGTGLMLIDLVPSPIDFAFLDSGPDEVRANELRALYPKLSPSGVVVVHDVGLQHTNQRRFFLEAVRELGMQFMILDTPRGLGIARKPWSE